MSNLLITVNDFKTYKNINNTEEDSKLQSIVVYTNSLVKHFCGRTFIDYVDTDKVEFIDARIDFKIFLPEYPIISVTSLELTEDNITYESLTLNEDFFVDSAFGYIVPAGSLPFGYNILYNPTNLKITYKGGYTEIPDDLKIAMLDLVEFYRSEEYTPRKSFSNNSIENLGFRETSGTAFPSHISRIINLYRNIT